MATRLQYRNSLKDKVVSIEDSGYGDFEFTDAEYNTYLELAVTRLFPAVYKRVQVAGLTPTNYGNANNVYIAATFPDRTFLVEDATELEPIRGWLPSGSGKILRLPKGIATFNLYYYDAYTLPSDDVTDAAIANIYTPLIVLGALVEALESRQDMGVRPDPPQNFPETSLLDRLYRRYEQLKQEVGMSLPVVVV